MGMPAFDRHFFAIQNPNIVPAHVQVSFLDGTTNRAQNRYHPSSSRLRNVDLLRSLVAYFAEGILVCGKEVFQGVFPG